MLKKPKNTVFWFCGRLRFFAGVLRIIAGCLRGVLVVNFCVYHDLWTKVIPTEKIDGYGVRTLSNSEMHPSRDPKSFQNSQVSKASAGRSWRRITWARQGDGCCESPWKLIGMSPLIFKAIQSKSRKQHLEILYLGSASTPNFSDCGFPANNTHMFPACFQSRHPLRHLSMKATHWVLPLQRNMAFGTFD